MLYNAGRQQWTTHKYSLLSSKCSLTHGMAMRILQGMSTPLSKLLSPCLPVLSLHSAALQCFSAHAQKAWERATASLSALEILTACITDTFVYSCKLCLHCEQKSYLTQLKMDSGMTFWKVKLHWRGHIFRHENQTCDFLFIGLSFVSRSLCLSQAFNTNCSVQNEHSQCSFIILHHIASF